MDTKAHAPTDPAHRNSRAGIDVDPGHKEQHPHGAPEAVVVQREHGGEGRAIDQDPVCDSVGRESVRVPIRINADVR